MVVATREESAVERSEPSISPGRQTGLVDTLVNKEAYASGVSWAAVIAGAFVAAALSLILLALGTGIGLSSVSPWSHAGASAATVSRLAIIWLIIIQILASAMGGYLAGRLRTKWSTIHTDEVYFRDTAHGFLVWAVGLVITAAFLASAAASLAGGPGQGEPASFSSAGGSATAPDLQTGGPSLNPNDYFIDTLFRSDPPTLDRSDGQVRGGGTHFYPCP